MTHKEVRQLQRKLNNFTDKFLYKVSPLQVDGDKGQATRKRIRQCKYWLGFHGPYNAKVGAHFLHRLDHPRWARKANKWEVVIGFGRRRKQKRHAKRNERKARRTTGVGTFDGRPVANWIIPYLEWARRNGWQGRVNSGWRDPAYSESLCFNMCGAPSCPGRCAGRASGHSQSTKPGGCVDVSDYVKFGQLMARAPFSPRLRNDLPIDRVHYSVSGH